MQHIHDSHTDQTTHAKSPLKARCSRQASFFMVSLEHRNTHLHSALTGPNTEELPIRLAHRVKELEELPRNLSKMPSIIKVKNWYAKSFQDLVELQPPQISNAMREQLISKSAESSLPHSVPNPSLARIIKPTYNSMHPSVPIGHRYAHFEFARWISCTHTSTY